MKNIKYIGIILAFTFLLNSCVFISKNYADISQDINKEEADIENLPNGNYRYCSEPASQPNTNDFDGEAWCFEFSKESDNIVGTYSYQAPKDTRQICIEGEAEGNNITGVGYEIIEYGKTKPDLEQEKIEISKDMVFTSKEDFWDNYDFVQNSFNLKAYSPHFYRLLKPLKPGNNYMAWIRFENVELNLSNFHQRELRKYSYQGKIKEVIPVGKCL